MRYPLAPRAQELAVAIALCFSIHSAQSQTQRAAGPAPRLADGHPDLGNGKGSWLPQIIDDISGNGGGEKDEKTRARQMTMVDERIDVPFLAWSGN
ncbi:MAG: hypothetical protein JO099_16670, partial [Acidobacteriia bacterium]|nr:hypothetical protein [Terriglobia bacterium]